MNSRVLLFLSLLIALFITGCNSTGVQAVVRPVHERYVGKMTMRSNVRGKEKQTIMRNGVEFAMRFKEAGEEHFTEGDIPEGETPFIRLPELFVDVGWMDIHHRENRDIKADGYSVGVGIKTPPPVRPGWGSDFNLRLGYFSLNFDRHTMDGLTPAWGYNGPTSDINLGAFYAFNLGNAYFLSPMGGVYFKSVDDEWDWLGDIYDDDDHHTSSRDPDNSDHDDFHLYSTGVYLGFKVNHSTLDDFDVNIYYFKGFNSVDGLNLSASIRF